MSSKGGGLLEVKKKKKKKKKHIHLTNENSRLGEPNLMLRHYLVQKYVSMHETYTRHTVVISSNAG